MPRKPPLGQHFLVRDDIADRIVDAARPEPGLGVLEIGPGEGVLTERLVDAGVDLTVIEYDTSLAHGVRRTWPDVTVIEGDAARVEWPPFDVLVSNLPFQISSPVLFRLFDTPDWTRAVLMVQREFGDRLLAGPGTSDYGRLTVKARLAATMERLVHVPRSAFSPPPDVDATVVVLEPRTPAVHASDPELLDGLVDHVFTQRRKQLRNSVGSFVASIGGDVDAARAVLDDMDISTTRPERLSPERFVLLADGLADIANVTE